MRLKNRFVATVRNSCDSWIYGNLLQTGKVLPDLFDLIATIVIELNRYLGCAIDDGARTEVAGIVVSRCRETTLRVLHDGSVIRVVVRERECLSPDVLGRDNSVQLVARRGVRAVSIGRGQLVAVVVITVSHGLHGFARGVPNLSRHSIQRIKFEAPSTPQPVRRGRHQSHGVVGKRGGVAVRIGLGDFPVESVVSGERRGVARRIDPSLRPR